jgi:hypothetical protein
VPELHRQVLVVTQPDSVCCQLKSVPEGPVTVLAFRTAVKGSSSGGIVVPAVAPGTIRGQHVTMELDAPALYWSRLVAVPVQTDEPTTERRVRPTGTLMPARSNRLKGFTFA